MAKVDRLLATLRGEPPPDEPPPQAEDAAAAPNASSEAVSALEARLAELEGKLSQLAAPPPMEEAPPADFAAEEVPPALPSEPAPEPPKAPTELTLFLHTKVELLERRLEMAQQEAIRANLLMREREEAQRKAQTEVEDLFRSIREAQRAANYDKTLREHYSSAASRVKELEGRLAAAQLKMIPADEVLRFVESEEGRAELKRRIEAQLGQAPSAPAAGAAPKEPPPAPPSAEFLAPPVSAPGTGFALEQLSVVLARVSDLERRLEEAQAERDRERESRRKWEQSTLEAMSLARSRFERSGGPDMLVEAALEAVVECVRQRDALQLEMSRTVEALKDEPTGSGAAAEMRGKLALAHKRMAELQSDIDKQLALVQAWVKRQTEGS